MLTPKHTLQVSKLPLRPFLSRVTNYDTLPSLSLTIFDSNPSSHFYDPPTNITLLNLKNKQILRAMQIQALKQGWISLNAKNFDLLWNTFVILRPEFCVATQWNNYPRTAQNKDAAVQEQAASHYECIINPVIVAAAEESMAMWEYDASYPNQKLQKVRPVAATVRYLTDQCE